MARIPVRFDDGDFTVVADLPKRIIWDRAKLAAMVERIRAAKDDPARYVDISLTVPRTLVSYTSRWKLAADILLSYPG